MTLVPGVGRFVGKMVWCYESVAAVGGEKPVPIRVFRPKVCN